MAVSAIPRPRGLRPYEPPKDLVPVPRRAAWLAVVCLQAAALYGGVALLGALWVWWDLLPYVSWSRGDLALFAWWLAAIGVFGIAGALLHATGRRRPGRRLLPALACAGAAMLLASLPLLCSPMAVWGALTDPPKAFLQKTGVVDGAVAIGVIACTGACLLTIAIGLVVALAGRRLRAMPRADVPSAGQFRVVHVVALVGVLGTVSGIVILAASAPDVLWTSTEVPGGDDLLAGRTRQEWLDGLRSPITRSGTLESVVRHGGDGVPVLVALADCAPLRGTERRHRAMHRFDALRNAVGAMGDWYFSVGEGEHDGVDGPENWKRASVLGLERIAREDVSALPALLEIQFPSGLHGVAGAAVLRAGADAVPALRGHLRGRHGHAAASMLALLAHEHPALRDEIVAALREAILDAATSWPIALLCPLAEVDPDAGEVFAQLLIREPSGREHRHDRAAYLEAMLQVRRLQPRVVAVLEREVEARGRVDAGALSLPAVTLAHARFPAVTARQDLCWALTSSAYTARRSAVRSLLTHGTAVRPYISEVLQALRAGKVFERDQAQLLAAIGGPQAAAECVRVCAGGSTLAFGIATAGWAADDPAGLQRLYQSWLVSPDAYLRSLALCAADRQGVRIATARRVALGLIEDANDDARRTAACVLRHWATDDPAALAACRRLADDPVPQVRVAAALSLGVATGELDAAFAAWSAAIATAPTPDAAMWHATQARVAAGLDGRFSRDVRRLLNTASGFTGMAARALCALDPDLSAPPQILSDLMAP